MPKGTQQDSILDQLKESETLYKTLVDSLIYPIIIHINGKVVFANEVMTQFTGLTIDELIGKDLSDLLIDPNDPHSKTLYYQFVDPTVQETEIDFYTESRKVILKSFMLRNTRIRYKGRNAILSILFDITERKKVEKYVLNKVIETEEKERKRFATDLHDDLGPTLSSIKLHLGLLQQSKDSVKTKENIVISTELIDEAIAKMRIISNNIMPRLLEGYGLDAALASFIKMVQRSGTFEVRLTSNLDDSRFSRQTELHFYRIICELINNTIKHSGGNRAFVTLKLSDHTINLKYSDNGKGYDVSELKKNPSGLGIGNILNRVEIINGKITFHKQNGKTVVKISKEIHPQDL